MTPEPPTWHMKQGGAGPGCTWAEGARPGSESAALTGAVPQPAKFKDKCGSQSSQLQASLTSTTSFPLSLA